MPREDFTDPPCGAIATTEGAVTWRVWAPHAERVELVLDGGPSHAMAAGPRGYFAHAAAGVREGQRYWYRLNGGPPRPDPASRWQPDGVTGPSAVLRPAPPARWPGVAREDLVVYELHVGTFTPEGTFDAVIPRLPALRELGVTAVELMPLGQFPGGRNWGYDGVLPYAVQDTYGGPHGLRRLVAACHAAGLAVVVDVVYNHFGPEGCYQREFGPYFTDRYKTPWGDAVNTDGRGSDAVRAYFLNNVRMWLEEYGADGLRLDAVHAIVDTSPVHLLRAIQAEVEAAGRRRGRPAFVIAESDLNDARLLLPASLGGYGLAAQWSDDFHHAAHAFLTGERQGYYADFGPAGDLAAVLERPFLYDGRYSAARGRRHGGPCGPLPGDRFVVCLQNHDQVGNRARGDRLAALVDGPRQRLAASLLLFAPHMPMLFMGEEYGEANPFLYFCSFADADLVRAVREGRRREFAEFTWRGDVPDPQGEATFAASKLSWDWSDPHRAGLRRLYRDLLAAHRRWPPLREFTRRSARLWPDAERAAVLELTRGSRGEVRAFFNLTDRPQTPRRRRRGRWRSRRSRPATADDAARVTRRTSCCRTSVPRGDRPPGPPAVAAWHARCGSYRRRGKA